MRLKYLYILLILCISCGTEEDKTPEENTAEEVAMEETFVPDTLFLDPNTFVDNYNDTIIEILESGGVCTTDSSQIMQKYLCDYNYWRVYRLGKGIPYSEGLICESRSLDFNGGALKSVLIFKRTEEGKTVKINHFLGKMLELQSSAPGYYDIVMSYRDSEIGHITVKHTFEESYFKPVDVLELNDFGIKAEFKDSINQLYLSDFRWGL